MTKILIVDDEPENIDATGIFLSTQRPDYEIVCATSVEEAIETIKAHMGSREPVDVILTDLVMQTSRDGMDLIFQARQIDSDIVCILFTGNEQQLDRFEAYRLGAFEVIEKASFGKASNDEILNKLSKAVEIRKNKRSYSFLKKYFDPKVASMLESGSERAQLTQKTVTIVFWDIRGFSNLCEMLKESPLSIAGFIDDYAAIASNAIALNGGILDKFIGDGVMAIYGYLADTEDDTDEGAENAVKSAFEFKTQFDKLIETWRPKWARITPQKIDINLGCGVHTGSVLVGEIGSSIRAQFTAIGAHVNFAARIEGRSTGGEIVISRSTQIRLPSRFLTEDMGVEENIKNINGRFELFKVVEIRNR